MGDPAGCGPQITIAAWHARQAKNFQPFFVIGPPELYANYAPVAEIDSPEAVATHFDTALPVLPLKLESLSALEIGAPNSEHASTILESITKAATFCLEGEASAIVTNPISKAVLYEAGFKHPGHTEFIAQLCTDYTHQACHPVMMLTGGGLRVMLATVHVPLMQVASHLSTDILTEVAQIAHQALKRDLGLASPRLAFTGLNPHAGENGTIGTEERDIINPAAAQLRADGISITDARPGDTVFHEALSGQYDAVIAMTHDQGLIPVKTLDIWGGVNTTLGLPIIRTSPDHGTAYDAAAAGTCKPDSLFSAIKLAETMTQNRERFDA